MIYTYCEVTADAALWHGIGLDVRDQHGHQHTSKDAENTAAYHTIRNDYPYNTHATQADIISARINSGFSDDRALVYLINERRREREEQARNSAIEAQARATIAHGDALIHAARIGRQAEEIRMGLRKDIKG